MICCLGLTTTISLAESVWLDPPAAQGSELIEPTQNIVGEILAVVQVIGVSVAIIMLIVLAIKYISAAPNDKAEIKKHAVVYVVGAVILFAASAIVGIIRNFAKDAFSVVSTITEVDSYRNKNYYRNLFRWYSKSIRI